MHSRMAPLVAGCIAVFATQVFATQVFAQGANPSADQIIKSLTPTGDMSKTATRGIRLSQPTETGDAAAPAAGAHKATGHAAVASMKPMGGTASPSDAAPSVNLTVNFATGSAELTPQAMQSLDVLGIALSSDALAHYRFRVEGHTIGRNVDRLGQFDGQSDQSQDPWKLNRWHLQLLNRTGSDGWELMHLQSHEGDYHYVFKRPAI